MVIENKLGTHHSRKMENIVEVDEYDSNIEAWCEDLWATKAIY